MLNFKFLFLFLICCFLIISFSSAVSITGDSKRLDFQPNLEKSFSFDVGGENNISVKLTGELSKYATLNDPNPRAGPRSISVHLKLPESLNKSGRWTLLVWASQINPNSGGISTRVIVRVPIAVDVPYHGVYLTGSLKIDKIELNQTGKIELKLLNKGEKDLNGFHFLMNVLDENNKSMKSFDEDLTKTIKSTKTESYFFNFSTKGWLPGLYPVTGNVTYGDKSLKLKGNLVIGDMDAYLQEVKPMIFWQDEINKITLVVGANWKKSRPVFGNVYLDNKRMEKTATEEIGDFKTVSYTVFIDTHGFEIGKHNLGVKLYYDGKEKFESRTIEIKPHIDNKITKEEPTSNVKLIVFTITSIIVVIIAVFLLFYYFYKK